MAREYVFNRIKEALRLHNGNAVKARQQIIAWTYEDAKLLHSLTRPHLTGIVAYAIDRYQRKALDDKQPTRKSFEDDLDKQPGENFGKEMLRSMVQGKPDVFGEEPLGISRGKSQASKKHEDIMRLLASKNKKGRLD